MTTTIIAEAGVNHNGSLELAGQLVAAAAAVGADLVKFQTFVASKNIAISAPKAEYQLSSTPDSESQLEMVQKLELPRSGHHYLLQECRRHGIEFFSTGFDIESVELLAELGLQRFKVPSGEVTNLPLLRRIGAYGKPIILSTGMCTLEEVGSALGILEIAGTPRSLITALHCNTEYPTPMSDVNLRAMLTIRDTFGVEVGYSDHTDGIEVAIAAVALGATVIEKHITLDRNLPGPDHRASLEPDGFRAMVLAIRNIEQALGDGIKRPSPSESKNLPIARKSLVAARLIRAGETFSADNLAVKRPGNGITPMRWDEIVGRIARRDFEPDELIEI